MRYAKASEGRRAERRSDVVVGGMDFLAGHFCLSAFPGCVARFGARFFWISRCISHNGRLDCRHDTHTFDRAHHRVI